MIGFRNEGVAVLNGDREALQEFIWHLPIAAMVTVLFAHVSGAFAAGAVYALGAS